MWELLETLTSQLQHEEYTIVLEKPLTQIVEVGRHHQNTPRSVMEAHSEQPPCAKVLWYGRLEDLSPASARDLPAQRLHPIPQTPSPLQSELKMITAAPKFKFQATPSCIQPPSTARYGLEAVAQNLL